MTKTYYPQFSKGARDEYLKMLEVLKEVHSDRHGFLGGYTYPPDMEAKETEFLYKLEEVIEELEKGSEEL